MDSDASNNMNDGLVDYFPRHLPNSTCDSYKQKSVEYTQLPNKKWTKLAAKKVLYWKNGKKITKPPIGATW